MRPIDPESIQGSALNFYFAKGKTLEERYRPLHEHILKRKANHVWQYSEVITAKIAAQTRMAEDPRGESKDMINVAMTDYMGLSHDQRIIDAVREAMERFGVHATASPVVAGMNSMTMEVEAKLCEVLQQEAATIFTNGWLACFGVMPALISKDDYVVMDSFVHNSLATGAAVATEHIAKFRHNNLADLEEKLKQIRAGNSKDAIFIVLETWYSINSDGPDLPRVMDLALRYECIVIVEPIRQILLHSFML
jgi:7-keto-8-aminopelargonate synthetase-like enzyme